MSDTEQDSPLVNDVVSVERTIAAPAEAIFAVIADPTRHRDFDGSGTVRDAKNVPHELALGEKFGMNMRLVMPYSMVSTVVEFEKDRRIAWQTLPSYPFVGKLAGGRIWRYELEPVQGGTRVRESWDISKEAALTKPVVKMAAETTRKNMTATLDRLATLLEG
jgi:uncharacterized protein YndB with AHSA1/START domain